MIDLKDLQAKYPIEEKQVKIKAWGGDVKIKRLTLEETSKYFHIKETDGAIEGMITAVSYALVDPKINTNDLNSLNESSFEGVQEIFDELMEFTNTKK